MEGPLEGEGVVHRHKGTWEEVLGVQILDRGALAEDVHVGLGDFRPVREAALVETLSHCGNA